MSVQRSQSSIERGQTAAYVVQVSTKNGSASGVSVALATQPTSQKPAFTSGCTKGEGTADCTVGAVSDKQPADLHALISVASSATSITSVKLTATASVVTSVKWTPPSATETVAVTGRPTSPPPSSALPSSAPPSSASQLPTAALPETALPLGPIPTLNGASSSVIHPGNASGLFPSISPSATPSPSPGVHPQNGKRSAAPIAVPSTVEFAKPALTAQVAGVIALAVAILLMLTRVFLRRRLRSRKQGS